MYPSLYQLNTKAYLSSLHDGSTLDDIPDKFIDDLARLGFDWLWLLGVWGIGPSGRTISRSTQTWIEEYREALPDLRTEDICGSPFAITGYSVDLSLGGDEALERIRTRLHQKGIRLMVDFIPNHIGLDHPWVSTNPEYLIAGEPSAPSRDSSTWIKLPCGRVFAYGRDPNFSGWPDTLQLNYFNPSLRQAMLEELRKIAAKADGIRCDMAMLIEPEIFMQTWSQRTNVTDYSSFWATAIPQTRNTYPNFVFMAEVYWNYEWKLQQYGFDFTYDKTLYDRLIRGKGNSIKLHLTAPLDFQDKMVRFLENHDEPRVARTMSLAQHRAAAIVTYCTPGMRFFHHGQTVGKKVRIPVHLRRGPEEHYDPEIVAFYEKLIPLINSKVNKEGAWTLLDTRSNEQNTGSDSDVLAFLIRHRDELRLIIVNYSNCDQECTISIPSSLLPPQNLAVRCILSGDDAALTVTLGAEIRIGLAAWEARIFSNVHATNDSNRAYIKI